jgi:hypothetical protein
MPLPKPEEGWLDIDGTRADQAPADRSYFLQWVRDDGLVHGTWMAEKGQVPPFPTRGGGTASNPHVAGGHGKAGKVLLISGLATGVVGGGSMIGAAVLKEQYLNSTVLTKQQPGRYWANQALGFGGIGLGVVGAGLTGVSLAVGF